MRGRSVPVTLGAIDRELAKRHLRDFVQIAWPVLEPTTRLVWGWPLDAICDHLEGITCGHIKNLIINVPPRFLKSSIVSVMFPAWEWLRTPEVKYLTGSYDLTLSTRDAVKTRQLINSPLYRALNADQFGDQRFLLSGDQNVKSRYVNDRAGHRICTSPTSRATGEGGNRIMVDDPHPVRDAQSDDAREKVIDWWDRTMSTRRNDANVDARIIIMQRLHEEDLSGHCLEQGIYDHLCLPLLYESDHPHKSRSFLHFVDPREGEGQLLMPERIGVELADELRVSLGTYGFVGQMQQRPAPSEGGILQRAWFKRYDVEPPLNECDRVITSWDLSFKGKDGRGSRAELAAVKNLSHVVGHVWAFKGAHSWLLDEFRGQWNILETIDAMRSARKRWPQASAHLVEDKANGPAIETLMKDEIPGLLMVEPKGSKIQRAYAIQPYCEAGNVHLPNPEHAPWVGEFLHEISTFPFGRFDDRVDTMSQALIFQHVDEVQRSLRALDRMVGG